MKPSPEIEAASTITASQFARRWWLHLAAILTLVSELFWLLPWFLVAIEPSYQVAMGLSALFLAGMMLAAYTITSISDILDLLTSIQITAHLLLLVGTFILGRIFLLTQPIDNPFNIEYNIDLGLFAWIFLVLLAWQRGYSLARAIIHPRNAWRRVELGALALGLFLLFFGSTRDWTPGVGWISLFLFSGFFAVVISRITSISLERGNTKNPFDRRWSLSIFGVLGGVFLTISVFVSLITGQYSSLLALLAQGIKYLFSVVVVLMSLPGLFIMWLLAPLRPDYQEAPPLEPTATPEPVDLTDQNQEQLFLNIQPPDLSSLLDILLALILWAVVIGLVILLIKRLRQPQSRRIQRADNGEPENLLENGQAGQLLRQALIGTLNNLVSILRPVRRVLAAARIRQIYAQLMDLCAELGQPRLPGQTPLEFLRVLYEIFPEHSDDLALITHAYMQIRYGETPESQEEILRVEAAWERVKQKGRPRRSVARA